MNKLSQKIAVGLLSGAAAFSNVNAEMTEHEHHNHHAMSESNGAQIIQSSPIKNPSLAGTINEDGKIVTDADFEGQKRLIFFGFTHCPDICPTGMATISAALRNIEEKHGADSLDNLSVLLVSTDPARDTPAQMKEWLGYFHDKIVGLTGDEDILKEKAENYRANKIGHHSPYLYIMDEQGAYMDIVSTQKGVDAVEKKIEENIFKTTPKSEHEHHMHHDM